MANNYRSAFCAFIAQGTDSGFDSLASDLFAFQFEHNPVYRSLLRTPSDFARHDD